MKCVVKYCGRDSAKFPEHSFLRFPDDISTKDRWIEFCRLDPVAEIKPSSRVCSAHFEEACFRPNLKGRRLRYADAVPTINAFTLDPKSDVEPATDFLQTLPLYSSPALQDHNYADFVTVVPDWIEDAKYNEPTNIDETGEEIISKIEIQLPQPDPERDVELMANTDEVCNSAEKETSFKLLRVANNWQERAKRWKANALFWKKKFTELNKNPSVVRKLKTVFRKDQMDIVFGNVKKVRKWSNETLMEGLQMRFACGRGYEKIRQLPYVALPSYSCLLGKIKSVHFDTGILHEVFELLKHKVSTMSGNELDCGIILDEMSIDESVEYCTNNRKYFGTITMPPSDELATHALVFMLAGIHVRWKQIVAYEFTGNSIPKGCLKKIVDEVICKAESIGLKVHFVTSDCGASNKTMWHDYGVSTKKATIQNDLSIDHPNDASRRMEFVPDPVHVFKNAVNGWIANAIITLPPWYVEEKELTCNEVNRNHLTLLVKSEQEQKLKLAHKLVEADVDFENLKTSKVDKMKVCNSTKYCNHSVAAALMLQSENSGQEHVKATSVFLADLARWFDLVSSRTTEDALNPSDQMKYEADIKHLEMMVKLVSDIKVGVDGHWKPWQAALVMATKAILRMQSKLFGQFGYPILYTSRFTQDCVENLFSVVRSKQRRPTPLQFKSHLRTITLSQYMSEVKNSSYNLDDREYLSGFMDHMRSMDRQQTTSMEAMASTSASTEGNLDFSSVETSEMAKRMLACINNAETNALFHVTGYIMGSIMKNSVTCSHCLQNCTTSVPFNKSFGKFSSLMANTKRRSHTYASEKIFNFVVCIDSVIQEHFMDKASIDKTKVIMAEKSLMSIPLDVSECHNIKMKLIRRYLQFKLKTERIRKFRKRKFDSRSMLN